jgi:excisionase family DNA binding protein
MTKRIHKDKEAEALMGLNTDWTNRHQLKTVQQASRLLQISPHTLRAWIADRRVGVVRLGRAVRIQLTEIERLIEHGQVPALEETRSND